MEKKSIKSWRQLRLLLISLVAIFAVPNCTYAQEVFTVVEQQPAFPGGMEALIKYLSENIVYPTIAEENGIQGRVICSFIVERDGSVTNVEVVKRVDPALDQEAVRVVKSMPKWIPGKVKGKAVRVKYTLPISFNLSEPAKSQSGESVYSVSEQMPSFPGGQEALIKYLSENVKYPKECEARGIQGRVMVQFIVEKDGQISSTSVVKSVDPVLDGEAVRVVYAMPKWIPGKIDGKAVRVKYTLPISFNLN